MLAFKFDDSAATLALFNDLIATITLMRTTTFFPEKTFYTGAYSLTLHD
jgi:hypothetical protein